MCTVSKPEVLTISGFAFFPSYLPVLGHPYVQKPHSDSQVWATWSLHQPQELLPHVTDRFFSGSLTLGPCPQGRLQEGKKSMYF
jgi:hypothetical protein